MNSLMASLRSRLDAGIRFVPSRLVQGNAIVESLPIYRDLLAEGFHRPFGSGFSKVDDDAVFVSSTSDCAQRLFQFSVLFRVFRKRPINHLSKKPAKRHSIPKPMTRNISKNVFDPGAKVIPP
jgi:hypothetical protein